MPVQTLDFALPHYRMDYIRELGKYQVEDKSIVVNIAAGGRPLRILDAPLPPLQAAIVSDCALRDLDEALVIHNYANCDPNDVATQQSLQHTWQSVWEQSGLARHKGVPFWTTPKARLRDGAEIKICYGHPSATAGAHREHPKVFDEFHVQLAGTGRVEKWRENDPASLYQEYILAPGATHASLCDEAGIYPWHRYYSITHVTFLVVEIDR